jgi:hypothetical protein
MTPTDRTALAGSPPRFRGLSPAQRGFALVVVLFAVGVATSALLLLQASAFRQAIGGREAVGAVRAKWAARAGLEATIARLALNTQSPVDSDAFVTIDDLAEVGRGAVFTRWSQTRDPVAEWEIYAWDGPDRFDGPADPHTKVHVARMTVDDLLQLDGMTEDVAAAIVDWIDPDDIVSEFGAEAGFYNRRTPPYEPRNAAPRSLEELELAAGVDPLLLRGEDWNLNGRLDPNEDDGDDSWPPDNADGALDAGWSEFITTESVDQGLAFSGQPRVYLPLATNTELAARIDGLVPIQARALIAATNLDDMDLDIFLRQGLAQIAIDTGEFSDTEIAQIAPLNRQQLEDIFNELTMNDPDLGPQPGKVNINLVRRETLDYVSLFRDNPGQADAVIFLRDSNPAGFVSIIDLLEVSSPTDVAELWQHLDVLSNAYVVTGRGRDLATGVEVELKATIERTRLPIVISEMRLR